MIQFNAFKMWSNLDNNLLKLRKKNHLEEPVKELEQSRNDVCKNKGSTQKTCTLPEKQFKVRRSLLIELFEDNIHIKSVYNIVISFFIVFVLRNLLKEFLHHGSLSNGINVIYTKFGKIHIVLIIWIINNILTISTYYGFLLWEITRQKVVNKRRWDIFCVVTLFSYYILSFYTVTAVIYKFNLPFSSAMILCTESVRFLMKIHAFVRENVKKVFNDRPNSKNEEMTIPPVSKFLYFLYVPTAVYRDEYPRTPSIRWDFVLYRAFEILAVIVFYAFCFEYVCKQIFKDACKKQMTALELITLSFEFSTPSIIILWGLFFVLLHSSQNLVGELMRFGDRMFYADWWTCTDMQQLYRKWNLVIGDWLYTYVHKDFCENVAPTARNRDLSKVITILLSAFVHEWICTVTTGFFLPVITLSMVLSAVLCVTINSKSKNSLVSLLYIFFMMLGFSFIGSIYGLEYFARMNLNIEKSFVPVFFTHNCAVLY